jgi:hypothetical protein
MMFRFFAKIIKRRAAAYLLSDLKRGDGFSLRPLPSAHRSKILNRFKP